MPNDGRAWNRTLRRETVGLAQTYTLGEKPVLVRPAVSADAEILEQFNAAMAEETEGKQLDRSVLRRGVAAMLKDSSRGRYLVAEEAGEILGALAITSEWSDWRNGWFWWIQSVYVAKEARRRGVYRALHDAVVSRAQQDDQVCGVRLYVESENAAARATYESLGMSESPYRLYEVSFLPS
ncbi:MAG: GNAT family N-acetyltransferase [Planctomycetota bacterium]|nr:GNAT family N-acetyltransferase [Planctomycetota bacterium]